MAYDERDPPIELPILDRLIDDNPDEGADRRRTRRQSVQQLRMGICRDIEALLNTRRRFIRPAGIYEQMPKSLMNYGLRDLTNEASGALDTDGLARTLRAAVAAREPRLENVTVTVESGRDERVIRFKVSALLRMREAADNIVFETQIEPVRRVLTVREST